MEFNTWAALQKCAKSLNLKIYVRTKNLRRVSYNKRPTVTCVMVKDGIRCEFMEQFDGTDKERLKAANRIMTLVMEIKGN